MKLKLFTHTDLDGIGCAILAKETFNNVDIEYCNYDDVNEKINNFFSSGNFLDYSHIFITDISVKEDLAKDIDICVHNVSSEIFLLDHHQTANYLNEYNWCKVIVEENGELTSGTRLFYNYLIEHNHLDSFSEWNHILLYFTEIVRKYDTWEWKTKYNDETPKKWNDLFYIYGRDLFIDKIQDNIANMNMIFDATDETILQLNQEKIDKYIDKKSEQIITKEIQGYKAGVVFAEQYHSELGNILSERNPELDFIVIINPSVSVSYRTVKDNINLGKDIASVYGGGGHPKAAGSPILDDIREQIINMIFG